MKKTRLAWPVITKTLLALIASLMVCNGSWGTVQAGYIVTDLGPWGGSGTGLRPNGINNAGQFTGASYPTGHAFVSTAGVITDLGTLGGTGSSGIAINNSGQVAGNSTTAQGATHGFLYSNGAMTDIGTLGGRSGSQVSGINSTGQIVGTSYTGADQRAFVYSGGVMTDLGTLGGASSHALGINDSGKIIGFSETSSNPGPSVLHGFVYSGGVMTDLGGFRPTGINSAGDMAGTTFDGAATHAVIYSATGVITDLGTLGNYGSYIGTTAINDLGQVIGTSSTPGGSLDGFLYSGGTMTDLNSLISPNSGWNLQSPYGINNHGDNVGVGYLNGVAEGFVLTVDNSGGPSPVPEPSSISLFALGAIGLAIRAYRRKQSKSAA